MPRKISVEELLALAEDTAELHLDKLFGELSQLDPEDAVITSFLEVLPLRASAEDESGSVALHAACTNINNIRPDVIDVLVSYYQDGAKKGNKFGLLPIHKAAAVYNTVHSLPTVQKVVEYNVDGLLQQSKDGQTPLHIALSNPCISTYPLVELFVKLNPDCVKLVDNYGHYPLHKAASKAHKLDGAVIDLLLQSCSDIATLKDKNGWLPLHWVLSRDQPNLEAIYILVEAYPEGLFDPDYAGNLPYDKLMQRQTGTNATEAGQEARKAVLELMQITRTQMLHARPQPARVPSPTLLELDYYDSL